MKTCPLFISFVLLILLPIAAPAQIDPDTEFLILTRDELSAEFQRLADHRTAQGIASEVVDAAAIVPSADQDWSQAIRAALSQAHTQGSLRSVLLAGETEIIPTRQIPMSLSRNGVRQDFLPCDLYFAALDGSWDADGDRVFGELPWRDGHVEDAEDDQVDFVPELQIGRAPVANADQAAVFVDKTLSVDAELSSIWRRRILLLAADGAIQLPNSYFTNLAGEIIAEQGWATERMTQLVSGPSVQPPALSLTVDNLGAAWSSGEHGLIIHLGRAVPDFLDLGQTVEGLGQWGKPETSSLTNTDHLPLLVTFAGRETLDEEELLAATILHPDGGAAAAIGFGPFLFALPAERLIRDLVDALRTEATVGAAMQVVRTNLAATFDTSLRADALLAWTLLGDPNLPSPLVQPTPVEQSMPALPMLQGLEVVPNPSNLSTEIRYSILGSNPADAHISIHDLRGRRVWSTKSRIDGEGPYSIVWKGRDDEGRIVATGVYFVSVEIEGRRVSRKLSLVR